MHELALVEPAPKPVKLTERPEVEGLRVTVQVVVTLTSTGLGEQFMETLGACLNASAIIIQVPPWPPTPNVGE